MATLTFISFIIPACNEETQIGGCIESIRQSVEYYRNPKELIERPQITYEIVVVLNRCTDSTEAVALNLGALCCKSEEKNLSIIRNTGARHAQGNIFVTIDADSRMSSGMISQIMRQLSNPNVVGGGTMIIPERMSLGIACTGLFLLPFILFQRISAGLFFVRRDDFEAIGGFNEEMLSAEDIDFAQRLKKYGKITGRKFITIWSAWIVTSCRKFDRFGDWYFVLHPLLLLRLLRGKDRRFSDLIWYDFHK